MFHGTSLNITYTYPSAGQNNGKIASQTDHISGETVTYVYDKLNRLMSATGSGWNQGFVYDPFGNLTDKNGTNSWHGVPDPATNHLGSVDANGNALSGPSAPGLSYDAENRLIGANSGYQQYAYDARNKRVWAVNWDSTHSFYVSETYYFYSPQGTLMAQFTPEYQQSTGTLGFLNGAARSYFGGRLLGNEDRLGSRGTYYPYGEDRGSQNPANDNVKFATYTRDSATGLDYADQRYYSAAPGRFLMPDRYTGSAKPADPRSWNRYGYVLGDPINGNDPTGRDDDDEDLCEELGLLENSEGTGCGEPYDPPPAPPPPDPLKCSFGGFITFPGGWYWQNAPTDANGNPTPNGTPAYGYWIPISIVFAASGGDGSYTFSDTQTYSVIDTFTYNDGTSSAGKAHGTESLPNAGTGNSAVFQDSPGVGWPGGDPGISGGVYVGNFTLTVSVTSDGETISCGTFWWQAIDLFQAVAGQTKPSTTGSSRRVIGVIP